MTVNWDAGIAINGEGETSPGSDYIRVELDTIPEWYSRSSDTPIRYLYVGTVGTVDGDYRTAGQRLIYANQELAASVGAGTGVYWLLPIGVSGTLYRGVGSMADGAPVACRVYNTAAQSISNNADNLLTFDSELWDDWGMHNPAVNPGRITVAVPGYYEIGASVRYAANATGIRSIKLSVNGTYFVDQRIPGDPLAGQDTSVNLTTIVKLSAGDYIEAVAVQTSGGNLNTVVSNYRSPQMWAVRVA